MPTFDVTIPANAGPGAAFDLQAPTGSMHQMIVPEGTAPGMTLTCMIVPAGARPGDEVVVETAQGEMAVTIPDMAPGELLVVDQGTDLRQWVGEDLEGGGGGWCDCVAAPMRSRRARLVCTCITLVLCLLMLLYALRPHHRYYGGYGGYGGYGHGGGYGGGYGAPNAYTQHVLDHSHVQYGADTYAAVSHPNTTVDGDDYPGKNEGFERGADESGKEIYRYEQNNQVCQRRTPHAAAAHAARRARHAPPRCRRHTPLPHAALARHAAPATHR